MCVEGWLFSVSVITVTHSSSGQVVVPEELRFPHACCVGIAAQTSLSLFNPSERWQQVSITVTSLAIDGEKVNQGLCIEKQMFKRQYLINCDKPLIEETDYCLLEQLVSLNHI